MANKELYLATHHSTLQGCTLEISAVDGGEAVTSSGIVLPKTIIRIIGTVPPSVIDVVDHEELSRAVALDALAKGAMPEVVTYEPDQVEHAVQGFIARHVVVAEGSMVLEGLSQALDSACQALARAGIHPGGLHTGVYL